MTLSCTLRSISHRHPICRASKYASYYSDIHVLFPINLRRIRRESVCAPVPPSRDKASRDKASRHKDGLQATAL